MTSSERLMYVQFASCVYWDLQSLEFENLNPFVQNEPFLYSLKTSENHTVFWCFQWVGKGCIGIEWVKNLENDVLKISNLLKSEWSQSVLKTSWSILEKISSGVFFKQRSETYLGLCQSTMMEIFYKHKW